MWQFTAKFDPNLWIFNLRRKRLMGSAHGVSIQYLFQQTSANMSGVVAQLAERLLLTIERTPV